MTVGDDALGYFSNEILLRVYVLGITLGLGASRSAPYHLVVILLSFFNSASCHCASCYWMLTCIPTLVVKIEIRPRIKEGSQNHKS